MRGLYGAAQLVIVLPPYTALRCDPLQTPRSDFSLSRSLPNGEGRARAHLPGGTLKSMRRYAASEPQHNMRNLRGRPEASADDLEHIGGASDAYATPIQYVRVHHGSSYIGVSEQLLDCPYVSPALQKMGRKRMPQRMTRSPL